MSELRVPLFRTADFRNLSVSAKKPAFVSVRVIIDQDDLIYVEKNGSVREVIGYQDKDTGLFHVKLNAADESAPLPHNEFRRAACRYAEAKVDEKLTELKQFHDADDAAYKKQYKPLKQIEKELNNELEDRLEFYNDLDKQLAQVHSNILPTTINDRILYQDDDIDEFSKRVKRGDTVVRHLATGRVPYNNPANQTLTDEQRQLVDKFLDVFVDDSNKRILSWYLGAMLLNLPVKIDNVSRLMIVSSARGGSGKSTLLTALTSALLTSRFRDVHSTFDNFFLLNNRFGSADLLPVRLIMYLEATFNDMQHDGNNFDGLDDSGIKTMVTDDTLDQEQKYGKRRATMIDSFQIVLTNHPPVIDDNHQSMARRLIALIIKPSSMADKGEQLQLTSQTAINDFVEKNVQAFANYFVTCYRENPTAFNGWEYDHDETEAEIVAASQEELRAVNYANEELSKLKTHEVTKVIAELGRRKNHDLTELNNAIWQARRDGDANKNGDIRWDGDILYMNSSRGFFAKYHVPLSIREQLKMLYGAPISKFHKRMFRLQQVKACGD